MNVGLYHARAGRRHAGGKAVFVRELASSLAPDHAVYLYTTFERPTPIVRDLRAAGVTVVDVPPVESRLATGAVTHLTPFQRDDVLTLGNAVRRGLIGRIDREVDVLLTHTYLDDLVLSNLVDVPVVYEYHNVQQVGLGATCRERFSDADYHLANSEKTRREVRSKVGRTVDGVLAPGIDVDRFSPEANAAIDRDEPVVLFVGRVVESKGIFDLIDAVARARADPHLVVAGSGDLDEAREVANDCGVAADVTVAGEVPHDDLPGYYAGCDVVCNPSHYEGFGMVNLEAMACGAPLIASKLDSVGEYATHGRTATLVDPGDVAALADEIDALLSDPDRRAAMGERARAAALEYAWDRQSEKLLDHCERAIAGRAGHSA